MRYSVWESDVLVKVEMTGMELARIDDVLQMFDAQVGDKDLFEPHQKQQVKRATKSIHDIRMRLENEILAPDAARQIPGAHLAKGETE